MDTSRFEKLVSSALSSFPKRLRDAISNVAIVVENSPRKRHANEIEIGNKGLLLGLYEGIPQTEWCRTQSGVLPAPLWRRHKFSSNFFPRAKPS